MLKHEREHLEQMQGITNQTINALDRLDRAKAIVSRGAADARRLIWIASHYNLTIERLDRQVEQITSQTIANLQHML